MRKLITNTEILSEFLGYDEKDLEFEKVVNNLDKYDVEYFEGKRPWHIKCDIAIPSATQNEINIDDANNLIKSNISSTAISFN